MEIEEIFAITVAIAFLSLPFLIWRSIHKESNKINKAAKSIKPGDMYICEYRVDGDPFKEPYKDYARVEEIKLGHDGNYWIKYSIGETFCEAKYEVGKKDCKTRSRNLRRFLLDFKPIKGNNQ